MSVLMFTLLWQVRSLLQAMQEEMAKDAERDEAVHDKQAISECH